MNGLYKCVTNGKAPIEVRRGTKSHKRQRWRGTGSGAGWRSGCLGISVSVIKHHEQKQLGGKGVYFLSGHSHHWGNLGQELGTGTWRKEPKQNHGGMLLTSLLLRACTDLLSDTLQDHQLRGGPPTVGGPPLSIIDHKNLYELSCRKS